MLFSMQMITDGLEPAALDCWKELLLFSTLLLFEGIQLKVQEFINL